MIGRSYLIEKLAKDALGKNDITTLTVSDEEVIGKSITGQETTLTYYYCDFSDQRSLEPQSLLGTILKQLLEMIVIPLALEQQLERCYRPHTRTATAQELFLALLEVLPLFSKVYVLIDGLDEYRKEDLTLILPMLEQLSRLACPTIKMVLFSREDNAIFHSFKAYPRIRISIDMISLDIKSFVEDAVQAKVASGELQVSDTSLQEDIIAALQDGADGM